MSSDDYDDWQDQAISAMYEQVTSDPQVRQQFHEELYDEIVRDFAELRLRSYYEENPALIEPAVVALKDAEGFHGNNDTAAFIFGWIAAEVAIRAGLLKPIVHGLVHAPAAAILITEMAMAHTGDRFSKVLLDLLAQHGNVDLRQVTGAWGNQNLWAEFTAIREKRNAVMHRGDRSSKDDASAAIAVAKHVIEQVFPGVVLAMGFHLHGARVCNSSHMFDGPISST